MVGTHVFRGSMTNRRTPEWQPLLDVVGEEVTSRFMWMFEVRLDDGRSLHAYKHIDTRRYVHLDADGAAFFYRPPDFYRSLPVAVVLGEVFAWLARLIGVTPDEVEAARGAVANNR